MFAITPFNFTAIGLNLPTSPVVMGNTVVWKPATTSSLSTWRAFQVLEAAGLPPGVINVLHGRGATVGDPILARPELAGLHFTGSTATFQRLWGTIGQRIGAYRQYPRIVGETGGKDFILAHTSADPEAVAVGILRGAFEYQGQKCSAASRMYLPSTLWPQIREQLVEQLAAMSMGDTRDFSNFIGPVIDGSAFRDHEAYLELGRTTATTIAGGQADSSVGWFVQPTVFQVDDPRHRLMAEEIFGPIATVFVYEPSAWRETLALVDGTSPYALTGALFARDRRVIHEASEALRFAAGNFYINDKPTGAVVGPTALRRIAGIGDQRQGRIDPQPAAVDQPPRHQGDLRSAYGLALSISGVTTPVSTATSPSSSRSGASCRIRSALGPREGTPRMLPPGRASRSARWRLALIWPNRTGSS